MYIIEKLILHTYRRVDDLSSIQQQVVICDRFSFLLLEIYLFSTAIMTVNGNI